MSKIASSAVKGLAHQVLYKTHLVNLKVMGYLKWIRQLKCQHYKWVSLGKEGDEFNKTMIRVAGDTNNIGVTVEKLRFTS
jgi:hypothetical protein